MSLRRSIAALMSLTAAAALAGCSSSSYADRKSTPAPVEPEHPNVVVQGIDGTLMAGELLNGSVTVDSGQGELTLLTDHLHSIAMTQDSDKLDSDSMKVTGRIKDTRFMLRNEHGVFTLSKDRLKKIDFVTNPAPPMANTASSSSSGSTALIYGGGSATATHRSAGSTAPSR